MQSSNQLQDLLRSVNRKSYPAYKSLKGIYQFDRYQLSIDHVQGDPFASPSHISVRISHKDAGFPADYYKDQLTRTTLADFLTRQFEQQVNRYTFRAKGSGKSGLISVTHCGQEVLPRTACEISDQGVTARFFVGFPANGRTINSGELEKIFFEFLPVCMQKAFLYRNLNKKELEQAIFLAEDQAFIRKELEKRSLVAFVNDGAVLPRESGISSRPMKDCVAFVSPESLRISMELPHKGTITGMGIPKGITLIVGGGYHGKSTLLGALELGVYNHIAGDGREYVITDATAQKLRSEDGRFVKDVDISLFINDLPNKKDTHCFSTEDASGSTSQAAGIVEGMEAGSLVFLLDEDTSATNFMVRDAFMQQIIRREKEPITPFLERAGDLYEKSGISTILVAGSSGAFFHIADTIIQMDNYLPVDITASTKALCRDYPLSSSHAPAFQIPSSHRIMTKTAPAPGRRTNYYGRPQTQTQPERLKVKTHGRDGFSLGKQEIDLRYIEQLIDSEQTAALGLLLKYAIEHLIDGKKTVREIVEFLAGKLQKEGLAFLSEGYISCGYAMPRIQEIYSCFNRYRRP
ncbi:ABC-ATPase domain-containing protein [Ruminococcus sp. 5_1_39BFAA]|uniref:ABC-ATPase domain-containing protein n=1 Tax=Ruminococcus sp. 5_1_39BFAA TaxID=457412 RepID=UPI003564BA3F